MIRADLFDRGLRSLEPPKDTAAQEARPIYVFSCCAAALIPSEGAQRPQAYRRAGGRPYTRALLGLIGNSMQDVRFAPVLLGKSQFAIAQRALPIFLGTYTHPLTEGKCAIVQGVPTKQAN
jgi:hypothetical protein